MGARVDQVPVKTIELPTTSLENMPHIKYPFEQLNQKTRPAGLYLI